MFYFVTLFVFLFTCVSTGPLSDESTGIGKKFNIQAVLIAGSADWYNYRHQSDICHAFHVLRDHGVPEENIIVMMADDIANNSENPFKGQIFNSPDGPDVYRGVKKDYTGKEVTTKNFLGVLVGDQSLAAKGKRVLTTGPNDHVFVYFADHGGPGILGMPYGEYLTSDALNSTLSYMHENKLYGKLTFYVEACEAGSIFDKILPKNINIFVTTASNPEESSYGTYCDTSKLYGNCLGDEYSVAWMQDSDAENLQTETLQQQFKNVVKNTPSSHPQEYGQKSLANLDVAEFQGEGETAHQNRRRVPATGSVNSRDIPVHSLQKRLQRTNDVNKVNELQEKLTTVIAGRKYLKKTMKKIISNLCTSGFCSDVNTVFSTRKSLKDHKTWSKVVDKFATSCINFSTHYDTLKYMYTLVNIIESDQFSEASLPRFMRALEKSCRRHFANNTFQAII